MRGHLNKQNKQTNSDSKCSASFRGWAGRRSTTPTPPPTPDEEEEEEEEEEDQEEEEVLEQEN